MKNAILALMSDGQRRTSYEIFKSLYGLDPRSPANAACWFKVSSLCDSLVVHFHLLDCGKNSAGQTIYMQPR